MHFYCVRSFGQEKQSHLRSLAEIGEVVGEWERKEGNSKRNKKATDANVNFRSDFASLRQSRSLACGFARPTQGCQNEDDDHKL